MRWANGLSERADVPSALADVLGQTSAVPDPDLVLLFTSGAHDANLAALSTALGSTFGKACVVGTVGGGVVGAGREIEGDTGLSVTLARLPGVALHPFRVSPDGASWSAERWRSTVDADRGVFVLADPFSIDISSALPALHAAFPGVPVVGGLGTARPDQPETRLVIDGVPHAAGAVGLGLSGAVRLTTCVAQGCRPLGAPMFVTRCEGNHIFEVDGRPVVEVLREVYASLGPVDQALFGSALFVGVQMRDQTEYVPGDFLIRNVVGIASDPEALLVAYLPERFQVIQLHVRDADAARQDVTAALRATEADPRGALLVSCVGRGRGLFGEPDHDSRRFAERFGDVPLGGFFANGEIGPVQGQPYLHGYTSVFALFEPPAGG